MRTPLALLLLCALTMLAYLPGVGEGFVFDDFPNIVENGSLHEVASALPSWDAFERLFTGSPRPLAALTFAANLRLGDGLASGFKAVNVGIHIANGLLVFLFTALLLARLTGIDARRRKLLALVIAGVWMLHPIALTSVLYVVQRMNALSALFVLGGMVSWLATDNGRWNLATRVVMLAIATLLAYLCKENGALLPLFVALYEMARGRFRGARTFAVACITIAACVVALHASGYVDAVFAGYQVRAWGPWERLLTQARVLGSYLEWIIAPDIQALGLYHDDIAPSRSLLDPATTLAAVMLHVSILFVAVAARKRLPLLFFGVMFFYAGHAIESTILPLELVHEHRNYLPQLGIWLAFAALVDAFLPLVDERVIKVAGLAVVLVFACATAVRAWTWQPTSLHLLIEANHHPGSARATAGLASVFSHAARNADDAAMKEDFRHRALALYDHSHALDPANFTGAFGRLYNRGENPGPNDIAYLEQLAPRMLAQPYWANNENLLHELVACSVGNRCNYGAKRIQSFLEQVGMHESTLPEFRAGAVLAAASHAYYALDDVRRAATLIAPQWNVIRSSRRLCSVYRGLREGMADDPEAAALPLPECGQEGTAE